MTYRLAFLRTKDGYLKVTASAQGAPLLVAIHLNPDALTMTARMANISQQDVYSLNWTANRAWDSDGMDLCCEAIELDSDQIKSLGFSEDWRRFA
jgi:hypothetical protein